MKEESEQKTDDNEEYVAIIINNMLLNIYLVDRERVEEIYDLIYTFWNKYGEYTLRIKFFSHQDMWITAERTTQAEQFWHKSYSLGPTTILGGLSCIVI